MSTPARILMVQGDTTPPAPTSGQILLYAKTSGTFYSLDSAGNETPLGGGSGGGTGNVSSVSVVTANGISGTVVNPTTTPAITLSLSDITPTSISATGAITASNISGVNTGDETNASIKTKLGITTLSGSNTGDQVITLTGDVTGTGSGSFATTLANTAVVPNTYGSATQIPVFTVDSKGRITGVTNTPISAGGAGTVTSVQVSGGTTGMSFTGGPITSSGTLTLSGTLDLDNGGTGATTAAGARNAILPTQTGNAGRFLTTDGTNVSWATVSGTGSVTSVTVTGTDGITATGGPITSSGTITLSLTDTGVTANTYGSATQVPVFTVDANGRITNVTNTTITASGGSSAPEVVVFHYSSGGSGNFTLADAIYSQTSGVTATITDGANCIATYSFTGKTNPPKSVTMYGQNYSANTFSVTSWPATGAPAANYKIAGGGTAASPDLANGIFSSANLVTMQTRMSDTGASAGLGQRAWLVVVFGF